MVKKINTYKIEHQSSIDMFVGDYANLIKKPETNYENQFMINQTFKEEIEKKKKLKGFNRKKKKIGDGI